MDQWNRTESRKKKNTQQEKKKKHEKKNRVQTDLHKHGQLIFDKHAKAIKRRKDSIFNKQCWDNWLSICSKWILTKTSHLIRLTQNGSQI